MPDTKKYGIANANVNAAGDTDYVMKQALHYKALQCYGMHCNALQCNAQCNAINAQH